MPLHEYFFPEPEEMEDPEYWEDKEEVILIDVTLVPGNGTDYAALRYHRGDWEISLYYPYQISYDIRIGEYQAREILEEVFGKDVNEIDFHAHDYVYVE